MALTPAGGQLALYCGWGGPLNQPITPDASGHFDVPGVLNSNVPNRPVRYVGTVTGNTIQMDVVQTDTTPNTTRFTFTLTAGQTPPTFTGTCPG